MSINNQSYVINPSLSVKERDDDVLIVLPHERKKLQASKQFIKVLKIIEKPIELASVEELGINNKVLQFLLGEKILVPERDVQYYQNGLINHPKDTIGKKIDIMKINSNTEFQGQFCFIGVPVSYENKGLNSPVHGTSQIRANIKLFDTLSSLDFQKEEEFIFDLNHSKSYVGSDVVPYDIGDIIYDSRSESINDVNNKVKFIVKKVSDHKLKPLVLGGDHTITYPVVSTLMERYKNLTIIHFDAHTDRYESRLRNIQGLTIGNVFSELMKEKNFHQLVQVGIREFDKKDHNSIDLEDRVTIHSANKIHMLKDVTSIFSSLDKNNPVYISFDVDVLDPAYAPEVAWPVIGGLHYHQVSSLISHLCSNFNIVGADFVEVCAGNRKPNLAALSAANLATLITLNQNKKIVEVTSSC
ncbi:hypothetical protein BC6307_21055 [Sutcliffiella cohnii]|uniref:Agmatinase n=1 Tax=Sutcliffiella cohnii TaxID=33932 RepID=A0A223KVZ2_9BACI|nr:arginase family protein [Sutcliffiella cohnii]AST93577.1 hypothetical protein BC6307_21055 [Sutcliffiella cohnii]